MQLLRMCERPYMIQAKSVTDQILVYPPDRENKQRLAEKIIKLTHT